jgi:ribosomal protein L29
MLHRSSEDSRDMLKQQLTLMANTISDLQDQLRAQSLELKQFEQQSSRHQQENKELRDRLKTKSDVIRKQESLVEQLRSKLAELEKELAGVRGQLSSNELKTSTLEHQVEDMKKIISEKEAVIESNKQVISYLNEEQSKWQLGFIGTTPAAASRTAYEVHDVTPEMLPRPSAATGMTKSPQTYEYNPKLSILSKKSLSSPASQPAPAVKTASAEVYARGLANLGLSDKINEFNLDSLDEMNLFSTPSSNQAKLSELPYYAAAEKIGPTTTMKPSGEKTAHANVTPTAMTGGSTGKHYAWESPDWIEATLTAAGVRRS